MSLCPLLPSTICLLSVSTAHCTLCSFFVTMPTVIFFILSTACQYITLYRILVLCHYVHCCLLESSTVCRYVTLYNLLVMCLSVHCCVPQSFLCPSVPHTQQSVHCLSVPHTVPSSDFVSLCPLLSSTACPLSVITSHCTVFLDLCHYRHCCLYSLSTLCQYPYLTLTGLLITLLQWHLLQLHSDSLYCRNWHKSFQILRSLVQRKCVFFVICCRVFTVNT